MKIIDWTVTRKVNASLNVCIWNQWDHDHLNYTHKGYSETQVFFEDDGTSLMFHRLKVPFIPFLKINTVEMTSFIKDQNTVVTYGFQLGIQSLSTTKYKEISKDKCLVTLNYKFKLSGIQVLLYPILKILLPIWNERAWKEDLPLKERRQKVKRMNFKDFEGLPKNIEDRKFDGEIDFNIPVWRLRKSDNKLTEHIFYNFKKN